MLPEALYRQHFELGKHFSVSSWITSYICQLIGQKETKNVQLKYTDRRNLIMCLPDIQGVAKNIPTKLQFLRNDSKFNCSAWKDMHWAGVCDTDVRKIFKLSISSRPNHSQVMQSVQFVCHSFVLAVILSVCRITAKVISQFHWNLMIWLGLPIGRTD